MTQQYKKRYHNTNLYVQMALFVSAAPDQIYKLDLRIHLWYQFEKKKIRYDRK